MKGLNRAYLIGHIGHDPELRSTASGGSVLKVSLATPRSQKVNDVWVESPDWHRLTAFGQEAVFIAKYARKGDTMAVECTIRPNRWTDKEGKAHYEVNLLIERVLSLSTKTGSQDGPVPAENAGIPDELPEEARGSEGPG